MEGRPTPNTWRRGAQDDDRFERGLSLPALEELAAREDSVERDGISERSVYSMWCCVWATETMPDGWKLEMHPSPIDDLQADGSVEWDSWRRDFPDAPESVRHSRLYKYISPDGEVHLNSAPEGTTTVYHLLQQKDRDEPAASPRTGRTTHVCSYPWAMSFRGIVRAIKNSLLRTVVEEEVFVFLDVLSDGSHDTLKMAPADADQHEKEAWLQHKRSAIENATGVVQVCSQWNNPERLSRAWMLLEMVMAVTTGTPLIFAMEPKEQQAMASAMGRPASNWRPYDADVNEKLLQGWQLWREEDESNQEQNAHEMPITESYR
jgi:hypothetical protein